MAVALIVQLIYRLLLNKHYRTVQMIFRVKRLLGR